LPTEHERELLAKRWAKKDLPTLQNT